MKFYLNVDYTEFKPETYKGVVITNESRKEIIRINNGSFEDDADLAAMTLGQMVEANENNQPQLHYMSSCDNYLMDLDKQEVKKIKSNKVVDFNEYKNKNIITEQL